MANRPREAPDEPGPLPRPGRQQGSVAELVPEAPGSRPGPPQEPGHPGRLVDTSQHHPPPTG
ncbi:PREDICTED: proline-rich protein HaeIII subfamily 1-like [Pygoscelis adeliae]|uniref:proline-rich protein HaeIII subfamily 1-like n=1 Tax=Pygoscelis adeliae TaxID=9238 RepID=UPI0004F4FB0A|nr:PREDICTED: proline-rich protein HaeIII subfamily 1-like [Pygoscelis adeliae]